MLGNLAAPAIRRKLSEELMLIGALAMIAITGVFTALIGGLGSAVVLSFAVNAAASIGRMAFESIVQRDAPDANQGRVFAQYETRFQLSWVLAGVIPVLFTMPGQVGYLIVGLMGVFGTVSAVVGIRAEHAGRPLPPTLTARARQTLRKEVARRRQARGVDERRRPPNGRPAATAEAGREAPLTSAFAGAPATTVRRVIIVTAALKGGVGKTTTSVYLAAVAAASNRRSVTLVDADAQASSADWLEGADDDLLRKVSVIEAPTERLLLKALDRIPKDDLAVVDTPPGQERLLAKAFERASAVVVPTRVGGVETSVRSPCSTWCPRASRPGW